MHSSQDPWSHKEAGERDFTSLCVIIIQSVLYLDQSVSCKAGNSAVAFACASGRHSPFLISSSPPGAVVRVSRDNSHGKPLWTVKCSMNMSSFLVLCNFLGAWVALQVDSMPRADMGFSVPLLLPLDLACPDPSKRRSSVVYLGIELLVFLTRTFSPKIIIHITY